VLAAEGDREDQREDRLEREQQADARRRQRALREHLEQRRQHAAGDHEVGEPGEIARAECREHRDRASHRRQQAHGDRRRLERGEDDGICPRRPARDGDDLERVDHRPGQRPRFAGP